jgi:hypothetical protein
VDDLAAARHVADVRELEPFDVTDDGDAHQGPIARCMIDGCVGCASLFVS